MTIALHFEKEVAIYLCLQEGMVITCLREGRLPGLRQVKGYPRESTEGGDHLHVHSEGGYLFGLR